MAIHYVINDKGQMLFSAYDGSEDVPMVFRHLVGSPRWRKIPSGYEPYSGKFVIVGPFNPAPWTVLQPEEPDLIPDHEVFIKLFGEPPHDYEARQRYLDRLDDWGGLAEGDFQAVSGDLEIHGMPGSVFWLNVNASKVHGEVWVHVTQAKHSFPLPDFEQIGHMVARAQYYAWLNGHEFKTEEIHKFNRRLIKAA